ncbi:MAG TPA: DUF2304 domain-containing protein [Thermoanaerobaculia bacterium]|jgi:hypothetical protein|nr:DUF2304 domain-containing protein [Thermoanaerobaculia bacterium]
MNTELQITSLLTSVLAILLVVQLVRKRRLREDYALLWLAGGLVLLVFSLKKNLLDQLATLVGIAYAPSLLLLGAILLGFLLSMHFSVALSRLAEQNKRLAQELAILRLSVEELRNETGDDAR